jgi:hypothetical protein
MRPPEYNTVQHGPETFNLDVVQLFDNLFPGTSRFSLLGFLRDGSFRFREDRGIELWIHHNLF